MLTFVSGFDVHFFLPFVQLSNPLFFEPLSHSRLSKRCLRFLLLVAVSECTGQFSKHASSSLFLHTQLPDTVSTTQLESRRPSNQRSHRKVHNLSLRRRRDLKRHTIVCNRTHKKPNRQRIHPFTPIAVRTRSRLQTIPNIFARSAT